MSELFNTAKVLFGQATVEAKKLWKAGEKKVKDTAELVQVANSVRENGLSSDAIKKMSREEVEEAIWKTLNTGVKISGFTYRYDSMETLEKTLTEKQKIEFFNYFHLFSESEDENIYWKLTHSTPIERARTFLFVVTNFK